MRITFCLIAVAAVLGGCASDGDKVNNGKVTTFSLFEACYVRSTGEIVCADFPTDNSARFCVGGSSRSTDYFAYSEVYAEAKTYELVNGQCNLNAPLKAVDSLVLGYKFNTDDPRAGAGLRTKVCSNTSICEYSERFYGQTRTIVCSSSRADNKGLRAGNTSDPNLCSIP